MNHKSVRAVLVASLSITSTLAFATSQSNLQKSQNLETQITKNAAHSQTKVAKSSDESIRLEADIAALKQEVNNLKVYQTHLNGLIASQADEINSYNAQISQIDEIRQSIVPLMYEMLEGLKTIQDNDRPIRCEARHERLEKLSTMMTQADISDAEKYRRILEAYQIEMDYGTKMAAYSGPIVIDGQSIIVEKLYLGRISLVARSKDHQGYWAWDHSQKMWIAQDRSIGHDIDKAFDVAAKQASPTLLELPVSLSKGSLPKGEGE
ncbi:hypothetical protein A9264_11850 [Vibrio sp. UCD-FRSSP16_10]|uniref:DUF3450 domain-containing protein n=1 Tax=unclassified Vibrio TaxID=2614977 RepID=UPI0007FF1C14|nr:MULTISPECIES: DUF3450 domain-containing protein [unclassified Vibrio]OBT16327.1 hypothetical protein A9260_12060 [Vibrio sp. UCD-FRSSP16_30]OBT21192.1 hypothetical protein A9264_11850 [Vibrio sp. UCD-FRSSP16_10]